MLPHHWFCPCPQAIDYFESLLLAGERWKIRNGFIFHSHKTRLSLSPLNSRTDWAMFYFTHLFYFWKLPINSRDQVAGTFNILAGDPFGHIWKFIRYFAGERIVIISQSLTWFTFFWPPGTIFSVFFLNNFQWFVHNFLTSPSPVQRPVLHRKGSCYVRSRFFRPNLCIPLLRSWATSPH